MNQRKLGIFLSYLNILLQVIIGFIYVPILLHYIGKSEYGLYQLMGSSLPISALWTLAFRRRSSVSMPNIGR